MLSTQIPNNETYACFYFALQGVNAKLASDSTKTTKIMDIQSTQIESVLNAFYTDLHLSYEQKIKLLSEPFYFLSQEKILFCCHTLVTLFHFAPVNLLEEHFDFLLEAVNHGISKEEILQLITKSFTLYKHGLEPHTYRNEAFFYKNDLTLQTSFVYFLKKLSLTTAQLEALLPDKTALKSHPELTFLLIKENILTNFESLNQSGDLKAIKNLLCKYIKNLPWHVGNAALEEAIDKNHPLGKLFWFQRSTQAPTITRGSLREIMNEIRKRKLKIAINSDGDIISRPSSLFTPKTVTASNPLPHYPLSRYITYGLCLRGLSAHLSAGCIKEQLVYTFLAYFYREPQLTLLEKITLLKESYQTGFYKWCGVFINASSVSNLIIEKAPLAHLHEFFKFLHLSTKNVSHAEELYNLFLLLIPSQEPATLGKLLCKRDDKKLLQLYFDILKFITHEKPDCASHFPDLITLTDEPKFLFGLINNDLSSRQFHTINHLEKLKQCLLKYLKKLPHEDLMEILPNAIQKTHPLGEFFWQGEGSLKEGYLKRIVQLAKEKQIILSEKRAEHHAFTALDGITPELHESAIQFQNRL